MSTYYSRVYHNFEESFIGATTVAVLAQSCLGGIAAMAILTNGNNLVQMFQLFLVVCACLCFNGAVLSQQKPKVTFNILIIGVIVNVIIATINFIR